MKKKENGNAPVMFIFVFFMIFLLFGVAATMMTYAQVMTHQHEIDDDLCDSVLSSMVVDLDRYNNARRENEIQKSTGAGQIASLQAQLSAKIAEQNQHRANATKAKQDETAYQKQADELEKQADSYNGSASSAGSSAIMRHIDAEKCRREAEQDQRRQQSFRSDLAKDQADLTTAQNNYNYWKHINDTIKTAQDVRRMSRSEYEQLAKKLESTTYFFYDMPPYDNRTGGIFGISDGIMKDIIIPDGIQPNLRRSEWNLDYAKQKVASDQGVINYCIVDEQKQQAQAASYDQQAAQKRQEAQQYYAQADACQQQAQEKRNLSAQAKQTADTEDAAAKALQPEIDRLRQQLALLSQKPTDQVAVFYKSVDNSFSLYKSCFDNAKRQNDPAFFQNFSYDTYILYEVDPKQNKITVTSFSPNGQKTVTTGTCGSIQTPDGKKVTETSAYAKVSFAVKTYFRNIPAAQKARKIYCTIDQANYLQK